MLLAIVKNLLKLEFRELELEKLGEREQFLG